jgi:hypothetical protein
MLDYFSIWLRGNCPDNFYNFPERVVVWVMYGDFTGIGFVGR